MKFMIKTRRALASAAVLGLFGAISSLSQAAFVYTFDQIGQDVVINGSGSLNTSGLSLAFNFSQPCGSAGINPSYAYIGAGSGQCNFFNGATGPEFGVGTGSERRAAPAATTQASQQAVTLWPLRPGISLEVP